MRKSCHQFIPLFQQCLKKALGSQVYHQTLFCTVLTLPNDKIVDWSKLKAFADDKINVNEELKFGLGRLEYIVGKGENAGYQHFLLFPQCFQKTSFSELLNVVIVW